MFIWEDALMLLFPASLQYRTALHVSVEPGRLSESVWLMQWAYEGMHGAEAELQVLLTTGCRLQCSVKAKVDPLHDSAGIGAYYFSCLTL